jgi:hypothetical protein
MWGELHRQIGGVAAGERREEQLKEVDEFWGGMLRSGSQIRRHTGDRKSAEAIMSAILNARTKITLDIQTEMIDKKLPLDQTAAGQYLKQEYADLRHKYEVETEELQKSKQMAIDDKDEEMVAALNEEKSKLTGEMAKVKVEDQNLRLDFRALRDEKSRQFRDLAARKSPTETEESANASRENEILAGMVEELQRSIERQEEEHRSEMLQQERKLRATTNNVSAENKVLAEIVQRLNHDKAELERLVRTQQVRRPQASSQHVGGPHKERVVQRRRAPPSPPRQQQQQQTISQGLAQAAALCAVKFARWTYT